MVQRAARHALQKIQETRLKRVNAVRLPELGDAQRSAFRAAWNLAEMVPEMARQRGNVLAIPALIDRQVGKALDKTPVDAVEVSAASGARAHQKWL